MNFNNCNVCTKRSCSINAIIDSAPNLRSHALRIATAVCPGFEPIKRTFKLGILALAHPTSLNEALSQFPWAKAIMSMQLR